MKIFKKLLTSVCIIFTIVTALYMLVLQAFKAEEIWQDKLIDLDLKELFKRM